MAAERPGPPSSASPSNADWLLGPRATLADAVRRVRGGAPLLGLLDAGGALAGTIDALTVRIAHVSAQDPSSAAAALAQPAQPLREDEVGTASAASEGGPVVAARPVVDGRGAPVSLHLERAPARGLAAVVMAGGLGRRLRPLTESVPKPLLEVAGSPLLERVLLHLERHGVRRALVSVRYLAEAVERFLEEGGRWSLAVDALPEERALGTAGALALARGRVGEGPFFLVNGDLVTDADLSAMLGHHLQSGAAATVATVPYAWRIPYGVVEPDGRRVEAIREKPLYRFETNAGLYVFEPRVLERLTPGEPRDMVELLNELSAAGEVVARFPLVEYWSDVGEPRDYQRVQDEVEPLDPRSQHAE